MMTFAPGESTSEGSANEHAWAEQWLYVDPAARSGAEDGERQRAH